MTFQKRLNLSPNKSLEMAGPDCATQALMMYTSPLDFPLSLIICFSIGFSPTCYLPHTTKYMTLHQNSCITQNNNITKMKVIQPTPSILCLSIMKKKSVEEILADFHIDQNVLPTADIQTTVFLSSNNEIVMFG